MFVRGRRVNVQGFSDFRIQIPEPAVKVVTLSADTKSAQEPPSKSSFMWALKPAKRENASPSLNRELGTISPFLRVIFNSATRSFVRLTKEPFIQLRFARSHGSASTSHFLTRTFTALLSLFCLETCCSFLERVKATVSPYK